MIIKQIFKRFHRTILPMLHLEKEVSSQCLRQMVTTFAGHSGLCYVIMCGISGTALLNPPSLVQNKLKNKIQENNGYKGLLSKYMQNSIIPLYLMSFYFNLQGLMSSMAIAGHINALPLNGVKLFVKKFPIVIGMTGWCLVPSVACLGCAVVCNIHLLYDNNFYNGLTYFAILLCFLLGTVSTIQTVRLLNGNIILRQKCAQISTKQNYHNIAKRYKRRVSTFH